MRMNMKIWLRNTGRKKADKCVEKLSLYKKSKGVVYASDYDTIKRWIIDRVEGQERKSNKFRKQGKIKDKKKERGGRDKIGTELCLFYRNNLKIIEKMKIL